MFSISSGKMASYSDIDHSRPDRPDHLKPDVTTCNKSYINDIFSGQIWSDLQAFKKRKLTLIKTSIKKIRVIKHLNNIFRGAFNYTILLISMSGFVPKNATGFRKILIIVSLIFIFYFVKYQHDNSRAAVIYFIISEICYIGFITSVLSENGLRNWFVKKWGSEYQGYIAYETILGFLFLQNGAGIGYIASSNPGNLFRFIPEEILFAIVIIMFTTGLIIKILAAKAVSIEIYYWKDMFLGRKISDFIVSGPYKYFSNPMYGIGQLQSYAVAIWYGSKYGLLAAFLNQSLLFLFYFMVERKFIRRIYNTD
jgi:protein-S-isoprenylcysteine O-methyltransferase Ste14